MRLAAPGLGCTAVPAGADRTAADAPAASVGTCAPSAGPAAPLPLFDAHIHPDVGRRIASGNAEMLFPARR